MKLNANRLSVLQAIAKRREATVYQLRFCAPFGVRYPGEWASPHCRWLLKNDLIEAAGKDRSGARIYKITDAGIKALEANA